MVVNWTLHLLSLNLVFLFHLTSLGNTTRIPLLNTHLRDSAFFLEPIRISHLLSCYQQRNPRFVLLYSTSPMSGALLQNPSIFLIKSNLNNPPHQQSKHYKNSTASPPSSSGRRPSHFLLLFSWALLT